MALVVIIVLLFLTVPLGYMPNAVLAAVVFLIGVELVDIKGMRSILRARPVEFIVALLTALTVIFVGVEQGIILAIVISIVVHLRHSYRPYDRLLTPKDAEGDWQDHAARARRAGGGRAARLPLRRQPLLRQRRALRDRGAGARRQGKRARSAGSAWTRATSRTWTSRGRPS